MTGAASYWARSALRRHWRSSVLAAVLVAIACAVPIAAATAARRTATVVERVREELLIGHVELQIEGVEPQQVDAIAALAGVENVGWYSVIFVRPSGTDLRPFADFFTFGSYDGVWGYEMMRPRVDEGRLPSPDAVDEVLVSRPLAQRLDLRPGDRFSVDSLTPEAVFASFANGGVPEPTGPVIDLVVTGVGLLAQETVAPDIVPNGTMMFTPAFLERYMGDVAAFNDLLHVEITGGDAAVPEFVTAVQAALDTEVFVTSVEQEVDPIATAVDVQHTALLLFLVVAGVAGAVAIAQVAARLAGRHAREVELLDALGMSLRRRIVAVVLVFAPAAVVGALVGTASSVATSRVLSFGTARRLERDHTLSVDWTVTVVGFLATVLAATGATVAAVIVAERRRRSPSARSRRPLAAVVATHASPATGVGVRWALVPGRGRTSSPVRSALAATVVAVAGSTGAVIFSSSLLRLLDTPPRQGITYDFEFGVVGEDAPDGVALPATKALTERDDLDGVSFLRVAKIDLGGETHDAFGLEQIRGDIGYSIVAGRAPVAENEVVVGADVLRGLDVDIGEALRLTGDSPTLTIVGQAVFPAIDDPNSLATGVGFTRSGLDAALATGGDEMTSSGFPQALVSFAPGVDEDDARRRYSDEFGARRSTNVATSLANLGETRHVPALLGGFLAMLGVLAFVHAIAVAAGRRRLDLAILRCLGFRSRQLAATAGAHAMTVIGVGVLVGLPLGVVVGRWAWRIVASAVGVASDAASTGRSTLIVLAVTVGVGVVLTVPWAWSAAAIRAGRVLRAE